MSQEILTTILVTFVIGANVLWYSAKFFIRKHGGKSNLFWGHFRDFKELSKLTSIEHPRGVTIEAKVYLYGIPFIVVAMFVFMFSLVGSNV
jgi:hypothetical protein